MRGDAVELTVVGVHRVERAVERGMLYQVPSGSKSSSSGLATGCAFWNALRFAIIFHVPLRPTWITPFGTWGTPCEQPAPASSA